MNINSLRDGVNNAVKEVVASYAEELKEIDDQLIPVADALVDYLSDGKRFRPLFALIGYMGAGGKIDSSTYKAVSALELLQASALIHDDLIDGSDTRRGKAAIHKQFGEAGGVLIGDLALSWGERSLHESGISFQAQLSVNPIHDVMRTELMSGQYLDVLEQSQKSSSIERSLKIARYKSGKYSIERPLHFGAALALPKHLHEYLSIYSEYGLPLGEAFQLRDDLLGVFGDPDITGKPAGDDLREGKRTALIAFAVERGVDLEGKLGNKNLSEEDVEELRKKITATGAPTHVEELIEKLSEEALDAINRDELSSDAKKFMEEMISLVTKREK